uniref:Uncharacterized protein n=1 Tax=Eptatretus burgeri TaxID=7764 RepID=A0A8C4X1I1_EPTBU
MSMTTSRQQTECCPIPSRRVVLNDPSQLPLDYSTTPGGTLYSTTPGGEITFNYSWIRIRIVTKIALFHPCHVPKLSTKFRPDPSTTF